MSVQPIQRETDSSGEALGLELEGIAKRFGRRWVLRGIDLQLSPGTVLGLTGRNGSGKTTLLRILCTLSRPTRGSAQLHGHDLVEDADEVRHRVGMLAHSPGLYPDLTAAENLRFARRMYGLGDGASAVMEVLERVGLEREADERVRFFSSGMQRRVALARLLLRPPRLLLLDEPHSAFDVNAVALVHDFIRAVRDAGGIVVVATHDPLRAERLWTRMLHLHEGVLAAGSLERYRDGVRFAAPQGSPSPVMEEHVG